MSFTIPQSTSFVVMFKAFLATDHATEATAKTIVITISKNGGAFGNPSAGATNATEVSSGWYKFTLSTTDTDTVGPIAIRGAVATIDDVGLLYNVVKATNGGWTALPDTAVTTNASLLTSGTGTAQLSVSSGLVTVGTLSASVITATSIAADAITAAKIANGAIDAATFAADVDAEVLSYLVDDATRIDASALNTATVTTIPAINTAVADIPTNAELATALGTSDDATLAAVATVDTVVDAIKVKTDSLTFTVANVIDANVQRVNDVTVTGVGSAGDPWGP